MKAIILKPLLTEKSMRNEQVYVFAVDHKANKNQIKTQLESLYKVTVKTVRTVLNKGKVKTIGRKRTKKTLANEKKAYVTLSKGEIPDIKVK